MRQAPFSGATDHSVNTIDKSHFQIKGLYFIRERERQHPTDNNK